MEQEEIQRKHSYTCGFSAVFRGNGLLPNSLVMIMQLKMVVDLPPVTKKNSQRLVVNKRTGRPMILPSKRYMDYELAARQFLTIPSKPINYPVNVKAIYYMPTARRVDLCNLHEALCDMLVHHGVLADDNSNIIQSMDGSRVYKDKDHPRTEIIIEAVMDNG